MLKGKLAHITYVHRAYMARRHTNRRKLLRASEHLKRNYYIYNICNDLNENVSGENFNQFEQTQLLNNGDDLKECVCV